MMETSRAPDSTAPARVAAGQERIFLKAEWRYLAMLNYEVDPALVAAYVPPGTELDRFDGKAFISLVGFLFLNTKILGISVPFHRNFDEVNLRFYVRRSVDGVVKRGVVFIREIVPRRAIAAVARLLPSSMPAGMVVAVDATGLAPTAASRSLVDLTRNRGAERTLH